MHWFSMGIAVLIAVAIIVIGLMYLFTPRAATLSFGLPLPEQGANTDWWLRLKGTRDIVSGLVLFAMIAWGSPHLLGVILLIQALIPVGDMSLVLTAKGSTGWALGIHGVTFALMVLAAFPLIVGVA